MYAPRHVSTGLVLVLVFLLCGTVVSAECPGTCSCRWKNGKQTVECRSGGGLREVPNNLDPATQVLDLSNNDLRSLPAEAFSRAGLMNLQKIYLANCGLTQIDDTTFAGLTNLVDLDLSGNRLTAVPKRSFERIAALRELKISNNPIQRVEEDTFAAVPGLVKLDLTDCQILEIEPAAFDPLKILEGLKISGNRLKELQERTVVALRGLHNVELHANPWECDCRLRPMRVWLRENNIPYPIAPTCHGPPRVAGRSFDDMAVDDFACPPQLLPMVRDVGATAEDNATLVCRIGAVPQAKIDWFWRGLPVQNNTRFNGGRQSILIAEEGKFERSSHLIITNVRSEDSSDEFLCVGVNKAGDVEANFTLTVGTRMALHSPLDSGQIAAIAVGLIIALVIIIALVFFLMSRKHGDEEEDKPKAHSNGNGVVMNVETAPDDEVNPVQKPPRLTDINYPPHYTTSNGSLVESSVYVRGPDLINEIDGRGYPVPAGGGSGGGAAYGAVPYYPAGLTSNPLADDSYELRQLPSTSDASDPERIDPSIYGYPADYGLPIPEVVESPYGVTRAPPGMMSPHRLSSGNLHQQPHHHYQEPPEALTSPDGHRPLSTSSMETPLNSSRDSRGDLSTSKDSVGSGARKKPWQMGVPVLPPLPNTTTRVGDAAGTDV